MENYLKNVAVRFRKTKISHEELEEIFKVQEESGFEWKTKYLNALYAKNIPLADKLAEETEITFFKYILDVFFNEFSLKNGEFQSFLSALKESFGNDYILDLKVDDTMIRIFTEDIEIKAMKLSEVMPDIKKKYPFIDKEERIGNCHQFCIEFVQLFNFKCNIATGYVAPLSQKNKNLHSWIELTLWGENMVLDFTRGLMFNKEGYYYLKNINENEVQLISRETFLKEINIFKYLAKNDAFLTKLYLANREDALNIYVYLKSKEITQNQPQ